VLILTMCNKDWISRFVWDWNLHGALLGSEKQGREMWDWNLHGALLGSEKQGREMWEGS
jgi:hypothetical protein